jgi:[ribosomal protein S5]-alanine N-acetyltransferase
MKILETDRLFLREFSNLDAQHLFDLNSDPDVIRYTGDKAFISIQEVEKFIKNYNHYQKYGFGRWAVIQKSNSDFLGWCGLKFSPDLDEVDIGFRFHKRYWNQGFATEAANPCLKFGFQKFNLNSIVGRAMKENLSSIRVLEKIGLTFEKQFNFDENEGVIYKISNPKN